MPQRQPLSYADYALVRFDTPENWMIITALLTFEGRLELEELSAIVERFMLPQRRFRQRLAPPRLPGGRPYWEDDQSFKLCRHITPIRTTLSADPWLLEELASRLMSVGLDFYRPPWQFYLVERYGTGSALLMRFHHSLADGASLVKMLFSLTRPQPIDIFETDPVTPSVQPDMPFSPNGTEPGIRQVLGRLGRSGLSLLVDDERRQETLRWGGDLLSAVAEMFTSQPDSSSALRGKIGEAKRLTWSAPVPLETLRRIGEVYYCTINDVLLSAMTGALRRYLGYNGETDGEEGESIPVLHGMVPVDMRRDARLGPLHPFLGETIRQPLGNQVGAALLELPLGIADPVNRLQVIHQSMDALKASGEALATYVFISGLGAVPASLHDLLIRFWSTKSSVMLTNVAGPEVPLYMGKHRIDTIIGWVPSFGPGALGVSFFSYNGALRIGIASDQGLLPDPERMVAYFLEEIEGLAARIADR